MPVPGDLPVFLELALSVCRLQNSAHRVETIVVPDKATPDIRRIVQREAADWAGTLSMRAFPRPERLFMPYLQNPFHNYGLQLITGVQAAAGSHVILHDADLFLLKPTVLDERYTRTRDDGLAVSGVDQAWDTWFAQRGLTIAATWELCARRDWIRSFPPSFHLGHVGEFQGEQHSFDITLHAQAVSDQRSIAIHAHDDAIVHFNHVIGTYRHFRRSRTSFLDDEFRLLLIRLFIDAFAQEPFDYKLPSLAELQRGIVDAGAPVTYPAPGTDSSAVYQDFRVKAERMFTGEWVRPALHGLVDEAFAPFDRYYGAA